MLNKKGLHSVQPLSWCGVLLSWNYFERTFKCLAEFDDGV